MGIQRSFRIMISSSYPPCCNPERNISDAATDKEGGRIYLIFCHQLQKQNELEELHYFPLLLSNQHRTTHPLCLTEPCKEM